MRFNEQDKLELDGEIREELLDISGRIYSIEEIEYEFYCPPSHDPTLNPFIPTSEPDCLFCPDCSSECYWIPCSQYPTQRPFYFESMWCPVCKLHFNLIKEN